MPQPGEGKSGRLVMEPVAADATARAPAPLPDNADFRRALRTWDTGPIRYLILKSEQDLFRLLTTDEDRLRFIQDFWSRRDRQPETVENEYHMEFWRRVAEADRRFIDSPEEGWKTDRGRMWIVLGPPDDVERFPMRAKGTDVQRWIYRNRPNLFLEPNFYVAFRRTFSGAWELSNNPRDFDPVFRDLEANIRPHIATGSPLAELAPNFGQRIPVASINPLNLFLDLGQAMAPPELYRVRDLSAQVETTEVFGTMDVRTAFEFLGPAAGGMVTTGVVVGILKGSLVSETDGEEADANLTIDVSIYPQEDETSEDVVRLRQAFGPSRENYVVPLSRRLLFRAQTLLEPGPYLAVYRIFDQTSGQSAQARETFTVPDRFASDLQVSTVILAHRLALLNLDAERPDAFTLGQYRVVPSLDATFRNGGTLAFYYQVSGAQLDTRSGRQRLDVEYSFAVSQGDRWTELGEALIYQDQENPQGWAVPLADWPPASYRLTVTITDVVTGARTSQQAFFRVLPGS